MRIHRLHLRNFRQHQDTELEFGAGITGIVGPNGAGKTTILEAMAWAMYGTPAARGSRDSIRRRGAGARERVEVELSFSLGAHQYRVVRSLNSAQLYQDGDPAPIENSLGSVSHRVTRLLGMSRDEFFNTYFTGQKELAVMAALSAPERAQFLSRVLGYEKIRSAQERLKEERSALRGRLDALRSSLGDPAELEAGERHALERRAAATAAEAASAEAWAGVERRLSELRPRAERLQQLRDAAMRLDADTRVADHEVDTAASRAAQLEAQVVEAAAAGSRLAEVAAQIAPLQRLRDEGAALEALAEVHSRRQALLAQLSDVRKHLVSVEERVARLPLATAVRSAQLRAEELRAALSVAALDAEHGRTAWVSDAQDAKTKRQALLDHYHDLRDQRHRLEHAGPEGNCPTCTRPLGTEYSNVIGLLDRQMDEVITNGNFYKQRIEQLQHEPPELAELDRRRAVVEQELSLVTGELGRLEAQIQEAGPLGQERKRLRKRVKELEGAMGAEAAPYDEERHRELQVEIRALEPLALEAERLHAIGERGAALRQELTATTLIRTAAMERATALRARLAELGYSEKAYREARETAESAERSRRVAELALAQAKGESGAATEAVQAAERRREEWKARERETAEAAHQLKQRQELDRSFTSLRAELNAELRPELSDLASRFLHDLTDGRYSELELNEEYGTILKENGDPKTVISGGEEDVANLALRLAISQMIADRAGQPLSLLVLDEIFGSLDDERRNSVVDLLRSLADQFPQVILITHIESVNQEFDRLIRVGLDEARGVAIAKDEQLAGHDVAA